MKFPFLRGRSLWVRLALVQFSVTFVAWLVLLGITRHQMTHEYQSTTDTQLSLVCEALAGISAQLADRPERLALAAAALEQAYIDSILLDEDEIRKVGFRPMFQVWSADGRLLYRSPAAPATALGRENAAHSLVNDHGERWYVARVRSADRRLLVLGAESIDDRERWFRQIFLGAGWFWSIMLAVTLTTTWITARFALKPLRRVAKEIAARKSDDFSPLLNGVRYIETRPLVVEINQLLARLSSLLQREKQFLADAAHELRTPIAAIQAQLHVYRHAGDDEERHAIYSDIEQGLERAASLSRQLITMSRLEADDYRLRLEDLDLTELARQAIARCVPLALSRGIDIRLEGDDPCPARADAFAMQSILHNLLDNAIKYGRDGGQIAVRAGLGDGIAVLELKDDGPGIAEEHRFRLCERFFRVPGNDAAGSGLGLAIVRSLIVLQQGRLELTDGLEGRGIGFRVSLPGRGPSERQTPAPAA